MCSDGSWLLSSTHTRRLPSSAITAASDLLSQKTDMLHNHSYTIACGRRFRTDRHCKRCPGISPDSLVKAKQGCVSKPENRNGSRICHKSRMCYTIIKHSITQAREMSTAGVMSYAIGVRIARFLFFGEEKDGTMIASYHKKRRLL